MRIVIQRVKDASVRVNGTLSGSIKKGLLVLVGIHESDSDEQLEWCCRKIPKLRIFNDNEGKMNLSVMDINGEILIVSQFTLYGNIKKGTRPSFIEAARPEKAERMYNQMIDKLKKETGLNVESGEFGAIMEVDFINDGPVTLVMDR
jgi:D-tyrosyl-tRNA(Tyr) deacylase